MLSTSDITDVIYNDCKALGIDVYRKGNIPSGVVSKERVVVLPKEQSPDTYWRKTFVEVNICVPDLREDVANLPRLAVLESVAQKLFDDVVGEYKSRYYKYGINSISGLNKDDALKCHYVNIRLLFEVLNVMEYETFHWN